MERCLLAKENMEIFVEGSRSRSGKLNSPKAGLLSVLMDSVREGETHSMHCRMATVFAATMICT